MALFFMWKIQPIENNRHTGQPKIGHELKTNSGRMIKKWAHKNLHQWIETLNIGQLVSYAAVTVEDL